MSTKEFPEVVDGLQRYGVTYCVDRENLTEEGFVAMHSDMYASVPFEYENVMEKIWS
jgi:hypothetical protein